MGYGQVGITNEETVACVYDQHGLQVTEGLSRIARKLSRRTKSEWTDRELTSRQTVARMVCTVLDK